MSPRSSLLTGSTPRRPSSSKRTSALRTPTAPINLSSWPWPNQAEKKSRSGFTITSSVMRRFMSSLSPHLDQPRLLALCPSPAEAADRPRRAASGRISGAALPHRSTEISCVPADKAGFAIFGSRGGAVAARRAHNPKVVSSNLTRATNSSRTQTGRPQGRLVFVYALALSHCWGAVSRILARCCGES